MPENASAPRAVRAPAAAPASRGVQAHTSAPAPAAPAAGPVPRTVGRLPLPLDSFVGRDGELVELQSLLGRHRLVTLTGPGGAGKTRLAVELGLRVQPRYPDGVWLVELASLTDAALLVQTVADCLGIREEAGRPVLHTLTDTLSQHRTLLVLDNCEHLVLPAAQLVEALLRHCPSLRVLATSREPLDVSGETVVRVGELPLPELRPNRTRAQLLTSAAIRLFVERARAAAPDFRLTDGNVSDVAALCTRLDGIPLAIELAARRVRLLPVAEINARLDDRFRLLTNGARTAAGRHRDLRTTIEWSHDLLEPSEQAVLRRLSVLVGGFGLTTATAACADGRTVLAEDMIDLLAGLEARSLIVPERGAVAGRFRQLESIRLYGREQLTIAGEADATFDRLAGHLLTLAEPIVGDEMLHCYQELEPLDTERANLTAAVEWAAQRGDSRYLPLAAALGRCWRHHGHAAKGRALLRTALETTGGAHPGRAAALEQAAALAAGQGDHTEAAALVSEAEQLALQSGRPIPLVRVLGTLARVHLSCDRNADAYAASARCLELVRPLDRPLDTAVCLHNLAWAALQSGNTELAGELMESCLPLYRRHSPHPLPPEWLHTAGAHALARKDAEAAEQHLREGLETYLLSADSGILPVTGVITLESLAVAAAQRDRPRRALRLAAVTSGLRRARRLHSDPATERELRQALAAARDLLSPADAQEAEREGSALSLPQALKYAVHDVWQEPVDDALPLTDREREIARLVAAGLTNRQLARRIHVSQRTVESHLESIRTRLDLRSRAQLAAWATRHLGAEVTDVGVADAAPG
ncbi:LuxR C-terminal-related transcriptional regulator [Streptomyces sp. NPDC004647]|uniref:ATP-binding protein n=1 Tax=Streptomyces sp. NPDC004647 TaxID=3154671 RepID=UPI0033AF02C1